MHTLKDLDAVLVWDFKAVSVRNVRLKAAKSALITATSVTHAAYPIPNLAILNAENAQKGASLASRELILAMCA